MSKLLSRLKKLYDMLRTDTETQVIIVDYADQFIGQRVGSLILEHDGLAAIYLRSMPQEVHSFSVCRYLNTENDIENWRGSSTHTGHYAVTIQSFKGQQMYFNFNKEITADDTLRILYTKKKTTP